MIWRDAVLEALHRFSTRHNTRKITRQQLIEEELDMIINTTNSEGATPSQTLSRVLQELRDENLLYFDSNGVYILLDTPINIEAEDLTDDTIDFVIQQKKLQIGIVPTDNQLAMTRQRKGQTRIRSLTLQNYGAQCALCDIAEVQLLVASHISRWADDLEGRGDLSNVICFCRFHDILFEYGYLSLTDDFQLLKKTNPPSQTINYLLNLSEKFRLPSNFFPSSYFLHKHRLRNAFDN
jgi:hypothetical protein